MKKIVVLTGAGMSQESGIPTFRDADGLWEGHDVMEVASPEGWNQNKALVLDFYNQRRRNAHKVDPNAGHLALAELEAHMEVVVVTQNVDNLHERAGSKQVMHLHGSLFESRSTLDPNLVYPIEGTELELGEKCEKGSQLRPNIVWFGEAVPMMEHAIQEAMAADIFAVVGTSLNVYPAAGLMDYVGNNVLKYIIDPNMPNIRPQENLILWEEKASTGCQRLLNEILQ